MLLLKFIRVSALSIEYRESSGRYTDDELSSVRLDKNADVAVGEERGPKSNSLGRKVSVREVVHHGTSINNESNTSIDCEGRALWELCEPRGQQTTMGTNRTNTDLTSNVKDLIGTSQDAPQSYGPGPSSGTLVERAAPEECRSNRGGEGNYLGRRTMIDAQPGPLRCASGVTAVSNLGIVPLAFQDVHPVAKTDPHGGAGMTDPALVTTKGRRVRWGFQRSGGGEAIGDPRVENSGRVPLDISRVNDTGVEIRGPSGCLYDGDELGGGTSPLVIQDSIGLQRTEGLSIGVDLGTKIGAKGENVELDVGSGKSSLAVAKSLVSTGPSRLLRSNSSVASIDVTADSTGCIAALRDDLPVPTRHANVTSEVNVRQTRKRSLTTPVIYDTVTRKKTTPREKTARRFGHLQTDKENFTGNPQDYMWLIKTRHRDDEDMLVYEVTSVYVLRNTGDIVGNRALVMKDGTLFSKDEYDPIHVRDLVILTNRYTKEREEQLQCNYANQHWSEET